MSLRLLTGATVVTVDAQHTVHTDGAVLIEDDRIAAVGDTEQLRAAHADIETVDCSGRVIIPGLINTHTHLFQTLLKGLGDDMVLKDWFTCMTGPSAVELTVADAYAAARHGAVEAVKSGTTTLVDFMYTHPRPGLTDAVVKALQETGIRGIVGRGYITSGQDYGVPAGLIESRQEALDDAEDLIRRHNRPEARVQVGLAPAMIWTVDLDTLQATRALADAHDDVLVMMHLSETEFETSYSLQHHGARDVQVLDRLSFLGPDVLAVHCVECG